MALPHTGRGRLAAQIVLFLLHSRQHGYCPLAYGPAAELSSTWWGAFELSDSE